jgi:hypothetical protein
MPRGRRARASNEGPRAGGRGPRASAAAPDAAMLRELLDRAVRALDELDSLFNETKSYFDDAVNGIVREFKLTEEEVNELNRFKETMLELLDRAHTQARERLPKLVAALEKFLSGDNSAITVERGGKETYRVRPSGEGWFVSASFRVGWRFTLNIHGVGADAVFPNVLKLPPEKLRSLQSGWRASDEGTLQCARPRPRMGTTRHWQVVAWAAVRYGLMSIAITGLNLNKRGLSIVWRLVARDWTQEWLGPEGKARAREEAEGNALGLLTLYLGDGTICARSFSIYNGYKVNYKPKKLIVEILKEAYECGYGKLLDIIKCEKWEKLKKQGPPKEDPVHVELAGCRFLLILEPAYSTFFARTLLKSEEEAVRCAQELAKLNVNVKISTSTRLRGDRAWKYWLVYLSGREVLELAERDEELLAALKRLTEKKTVQPKSPVIRKLLELAGSPPLPSYARSVFTW